MWADVTEENDLLPAHSPSELHDCCQVLESVTMLRLKTSSSLHQEFILIPPLLKVVSRKLEEFCR